MLNQLELILTEGAIVERLKAEFTIELDDAINHAGLIYDQPEILEHLYRQYIEIGKKYNLPIMLMTPTRRVNTESLANSIYHGKSVIWDSCAFLNKIRTSYDAYASKILIGGLMGCKGNAYSGEQMLSTEDAYAFHKQQAEQFRNQNIDYLFAGIMPEIEEAIGMAKAMAESGIPYIISFMIQDNGCLLDGTPLSKAIQLIDEQSDPNPVCYMTNCIHPANLIRALKQDVNKNKPHMQRFWGIQANASRLSCFQLDKQSDLVQDDFEELIENMLYLKENFGMKIFGGCCGTDHRFLEILATQLTNKQ